MNEEVHLHRLLHGQSELGVDCHGVHCLRGGGGQAVEVEENGDDDEKGQTEGRVSQQFAGRDLLLDEEVDLVATLEEDPVWKGEQGLDKGDH